MKASGNASYTILLAALICVAGSNRAYAYLDPGTLNMALQIVIGAIVGGLVAIKIYWHKVSVFLGRKFHQSDAGKSAGTKTKN